MRTGRGISLNPNVRAKTMPWDGATSSNIDTNGKRRAALLLPRKNLPERGIAGQSERPLEFGDGHGERNTEIHAPSVYSQRIESSLDSRILDKNILPILWGMDTWPKRAAFSAHIKAYQEKTGKTQAEVAADLGMALASLRQLLYQKARQASLETCQKAATLFGCSVTEFIDDPGSKPGGVDLPSDASPIQRWWFEQSIQALGDEELDDDDRRSIFDDLLRDIEKRKQMKRKFGKK